MRPSTAVLILYALLVFMSLLILLNLIDYGSSSRSPPAIALHVIAAAIPPQLAKDSNSLTLANAIVANRPYTHIADLLKIPVIKIFANDNPAIVGDVSIPGDMEKRDWIFNRLSNIFTVRSDTFTAYILVRLGTDGPQRRMIAIFDRSNVWSKEDKPKLVALHPVPDPR